MSIHLPSRPKILFLFSDTGGGHRSAAEAIIEALRLDYRDQLETEMVDFFKSYAPPPLDKMPAWYPSMVKSPPLWGLGFKLSNGHHRSRWIISSFWPYVRRAARQLVAEHPCDLIVSVHPVVNDPVLRAFDGNQPPYITVVTDLISTHALWYHKLADVCVVPTEVAYDRAIKYGMPPEKVRLLGLPVADRFCKPPGDRVALREKLGWPQHLPVVLLVGGGDGLGPLKKTARAIARSGLHIALVVVTGRNKNLRDELQNMSWPVPTFIYGFVREMPDFMRAADILVTKAGPGTISEAFNAALPLILYSRLPGQEDGNVAYVVTEGAGIWAPNPELIVEALSDWVHNPELRLRAVGACQRLARPNAAHDIAGIIAEKSGVVVEGSNQALRHLGAL